MADSGTRGAGRGAGPGGWPGRAAARVLPRIETAAQRARLTRVVIALALLGGFVLSHKLWVSSGRSFPAVPVFEFLPAVPVPLDYAWAWALVTSLLFVAASARARPWVFVFLALAVPLALLDQTRWQPWFYQYLFMLLVLAAGEGREGGEGDALAACGLAVACLYFWSGVQKLNPQFFAEVVPSLAAALPAWAARLPKPLALLVPLVEICAGVLLLTRRWRRVGLVLALVTHAAVLLLFFPARRNKMVWPWNAAMAAFVLILFRREGRGLRDFLPRRALSPQTLAVVLFGLLPLLSLFGLWERYLSGALYSGNTARAEVRLSRAVAERLPPPVQVKLRGEAEGAWLDLNHWSYVELKVPAYPSERLYRRVAAHLCGFAARPADVLLVTTGAPGLFGGRAPAESFDCGALARPPG